MRNINILINEDHSVSFENDYAGLNGENLQGNIVFKFKNFINGQARAEVVINNEDGYILLEKVGETYTMPIRSSLLTSDFIIMQLVIDEVGEDYPIWKSEAFTLKVGYSINAETTIPEDYPSWVQIINGLINDTEEALGNIDNALEQVNTAIEETNNLNIDVSKEDTTTTIELTKKDGTTKEVEIEDGEDLQFKWEGTSLGVKTSSQSTYQYVDLQGVQGETGAMGSPFTIAKTYSTEAQMIADYDNMQVGDYVMIDGDIELQENATLWVKEETPAPTTKWHYLADFSGASGIQGETGATPNIQIGTVTSGATPSVTRTGTNENPILNFVLQKGDKGDTGNTGATGATGNGISSIEKTAETPSQKDYRINYTNGEHFDYSVENGEVTQAQLDEVIAENDYLNSIIDQIVPKTTATGTSITLDDTLQAKMNMELNPSELEQIQTTQSANLFDENKYKNATYTTSTYKYTQLDIKGNRTLYFKASLKSGKTAISGLYLGITSNGANPNQGIIAFSIYGGAITATISTYSKDFTGIDTLYLAFYPTSVNVTDIFDTYDLWVSTDDISYVPFVPNSPSPDYPQEIHTISGDNTIKVVGKNLAKEVFDTKLQATGSGQNKVVSATTGYTAQIIKVKPNTSYTCSGDFSNFGDSAIRIVMFDSMPIVGSISTKFTYSNTTFTFTTDTNTQYIMLWNTFLRDTTAPNLFVCETQYADTYEPYQEQLAQINLGDLEYSKIGNYADVFMKPSGKNLLNINRELGTPSDTSYSNSTKRTFDVTKLIENLSSNNYYVNITTTYEILTNGIKINVAQSGYGLGFPMILQANTQYTISANINVSSSSMIRASYYKEDGTYISNDASSSTNNYLSFTTPNETYYVVILFTPQANTDVTFTNVQLEKGTATDYEPYNNNKWYLKKNIGKATLNGSESWNVNTTAVTGYDTWHIYYSSFENNKFLGDTIIYSEKMIGNVTWVLGGVSLAREQLSAAPAVLTIRLNQNRNIEHSINGIKTWLESNNIPMWLVLRTPTYTLLNDTLQNQLDTIESMLLSYKGQTNISQVNNDLPFIMTSTALKEL